MISYLENNAPIPIDWYQDLASAGQQFRHRPPFATPLGLLLKFQIGIRAVLRVLLDARDQSAPGENVMPRAM